MENKPTYPVDWTWGTVSLLAFGMALALILAGLLAVFHAVGDVVHFHLIRGAYDSVRFLLEESFGTVLAYGGAKGLNRATRNLW